MSRASVSAVHNGGKLTPSLIRQISLAHDDPQTTVRETCKHLRISRSSYYAALKLTAAPA